MQAALPPNMASEVQGEVPLGARVGTRVLGLFRGAVAELRHPGERRVPFLDGLRALAVLLVISHHVASAIEVSRPSNLFTRFPAFANGWLGVDLFFVLSGYFIGTQLWKELLRTGTVDLQAFMWRRGLRIWPLYFATYIAAFLLSPAHAAAHQYGWTDLLFITNYLDHGIVKGGWSLCSEEQFYLLAPLALLLFGRRSLGWYRGAILGLWSLEIVTRIATYVHATGHFLVKDPEAFTRIYTPLHTHSDGLLAGLLVANFALSPKPTGGLLAQRNLLLGLGFAVFLGCWALQSETLNFAGLAVFFATAVWWGLGSGARLLSGRFFYIVSRLSFGMYLNHQYMLGVVIDAVMRHIPAGPALASSLAYVLLTALSIVLAFGSFCLIEHPFLVLRTAVLRRRETVPLVAH